MPASSKPSNVPPKDSSLRPGEVFRYHNKAGWLAAQYLPDECEFPIPPELLNRIPKGLPGKIPDDLDELYSDLELKVQRKKRAGRHGGPARGLIKSPHVERILSGSKTWDIRGSRTNIRGPVALIRSGSGLIVGTYEVVDAIGPLTRSDLAKNARKIGFKPSEIGSRLPYKRTYAWVLRGARPLRGCQEITD